MHAMKTESLTRLFTMYALTDILESGRRDRRWHIVSGGPKTVNSIGSDCNEYLEAVCCFMVGVAGLLAKAEQTRYWPKHDHCRMHISMFGTTYKGNIMQWSDKLGQCCFCRRESRKGKNRPVFRELLITWPLLSSLAFLGFNRKDPLLGSEDWKHIFTGVDSFGYSRLASPPTFEVRTGFD